MGAAGGEDNEAACEGADEAEVVTEDDASAWMEDPPEGFGRQLSRFGILFTLLDGMVTESTLQCLRGSSSDGQRHSYPQACLLLPHAHIVSSRGFIGCVACSAAYS